METTLSANLTDVASVKVIEAKTPHGIMLRKSHVDDGLDNQYEKIGKKRSYPEKSIETGFLSHDTDEDEEGEKMMKMKVKKRKEENVIESPTSPSLTPMVPMNTQLVCCTCQIKFTSKKNFSRHQTVHSGVKFAMKGNTYQNRRTKKKELSLPIMVRSEIIENNFATKFDPSITKNNHQSGESPKPISEPLIIWEDNPSETNKTLINNDMSLAPSYPSCDAASNNDCNKISFFSQNGLLQHKKRKHFQKSVSHFSSKDKENVYCDNSNNPSNYVCSVCRKHFLHLDSCLCHQQHHHPNIECNFLEVVQGSNIAALHYPIPDQVGVLGRSVLDISVCNNITEYKVYRKYKCTKCSRIFHSVPRLHSHIIECSTILPCLTDNNYRCKTHINDLSYDPIIEMIRQE